MKVSEDMAAVGIDLGGTNLRGARIEGGKIVSEPYHIPTPDSPEKIVDALVEVINHFQGDSICGVGIATAGVVNCQTGEVVGSTGNLPGWAGTKIKQVVESKVGLPVYVENDANAAAYGESRVDELRKKNCIVVVTLGTGIGGGIVIDGNLLHGSGWAAGEIGHIAISLDNSRLCTCGLYNCWEAYGSGRGLEATALEMLKDVESSQSRLVSGGEKVSTYRIFQELSTGDKVAKSIVYRWHEHIAVGLVNLTHILNPDCFVITGGLSEVCDLDLLGKLVKERTLHKIGETVDIRPSQLGTNAGLIGAASCVIDKILKVETERGIASKSI